MDNRYEIAWSLLKIRLERKQRWGKNELLVLMDRCMADAGRFGRCDDAPRENESVSQSSDSV